MSDSKPGASAAKARSNKRPALGRGLGALIGGQSASPGEAPAGRRILDLPIEQIQPRSDQPRRKFDDTALDELAVSVKEKGVLSPILVRRQGKAYGLIAGERRWRAAQRAGMKTVPAVIEEADDDEAFEIALIENIQREDLNPLEEAEAYHRLMNGRKWTQEQLATHIGKDRSTIANSVRLLRLPEPIRAAVVDGRLTMGHARALAALTAEDGIEMAARQVLAKRLSVRDAESLVRRMKRGAKNPDAKEKKEGSTSSPEIRDLVARLERSLATRCRLDHKQGRGGKLTIEYQDLDDLDRIVGRILGPQ